MKYRGPIITLLAVAVLAGVLLVVNQRTVTQTQTAGRANSPAASAPIPGTAQGATAQQPAVTTLPSPPPDQVGRKRTGPDQSESDQPESDQSGQGQGEQSVYAGRTSGNEATIAIAVRGDEASAYLCDGKQVEAWLQGTITDGTLALQGRDEARADGVVQGDAVFGTVWVQGRQWPYAAQRAERPAGLYQGSGTVGGAPARVGWIVLQDGSQVGIADVAGAPRPAPPIDPHRLLGVQVGESAIVPHPVSGADDVVEPPR